MSVTPAGVPTKPHKAIAPIVVNILVAALTALVNNTTDVSIPPWLALTVSALLSAAAVYQTTNPPTGQGVN